jgi:hypothetical protein
MIQHLSPLGLNIDIAVHLLIIELAEKRSPRCFLPSEASRKPLRLPASGPIRRT